MMLEHIGELDAATRIGNAVRDALQGGRVKSLSAGAHSTTEFGDIVLDAMRAGATA